MQPPSFNPSADVDKRPPSISISFNEPEADMFQILHPWERESADQNPYPAPDTRLPFD